MLCGTAVARSRRACPGTATAQRLALPVAQDTVERVNMSRRRPSAFTLVELVVTLTVLGIALGIGAYAAAAMVGAGISVEAESTLDRVAAYQQRIDSTWGRFTPYGKDLATAFTDLTFVDNGAVSTGAAVVSISVGTGGTLGLAVRDPNGTCLYLRGEPVASGGSTSVITDLPDSAPCSGDQALPAGENPVAYSLDPADQTVRRPD